MRIKSAYTISHAVAAGVRRWRVWLATWFHRVTLAEVGIGCVFQAQVGFHPPANVHFGDNCFVARGTAASTEVATGYLRVGNDVQINREVHLDMTGGLTIGNNVLISEKAVLYTHNHGHDPRSAPALLAKTIGAGVWVGMHAVILPTCRKIGAGAIIGAGTIVTKDVPEGVIVAGNPAKIIGRHIEKQEVAA